MNRRQSALARELNSSLAMDDSLLEEQESTLQFHNKSKLSAFFQLFKVSFSKLELAPFSNGQERISTFATRRSIVLTVFVVLLGLVYAAELFFAIGETLSATTFQVNFANYEAQLKASNFLIFGAEISESQMFPLQVETACEGLKATSNGQTADVLS
jgi:hypothetical protein